MKIIKFPYMSKDHVLVLEEGNFHIYGNRYLIHNCNLKLVIDKYNSLNKVLDLVDCKCEIGWYSSSSLRDLMRKLDNI